jgi:hypothetical protein
LFHRRHARSRRNAQEDADTRRPTKPSSPTVRPGYDLESHPRVNARGNTGHVDLVGYVVDERGCEQGDIMPISKTQRWLDLIAYLAGRRVPVTVEQLMEGIPAYAEKWVEGSEKDRASVRRTFERDKDELRELGIPIETVQYRINYGAEETLAYRVARKDFYLPYLELLRRGKRAAASIVAAALTFCTSFCP